MTYEYATTYGALARFYEDEEDTPPDAPKEPDGNGWELVCMTSSSCLYWSWRRPTEPVVNDEKPFNREDLLTALAVFAPNLHALLTGSVEIP